MRLSQAMEQLEELLQSSDVTHWSLKERASHLNRHALSLARKMAATDEGYFNFLVPLAASQRRKIKADTWDYTLPTWIERIVEVRENSSATDPTGVVRGRVFPYVQKYGGFGYTMQGPNLRIVSGTEPSDLEVAVAKRPAKVTRGTLPTQANLPSPNTSYLRIDADTSADALNYPHETITDSYANALVEITGQTARSGQLRRVVGSDHFQNEGGTLYTVLQLEEPWTTQPLAADTYELHFEIPEQHMQLVVYLAAHTLWGTRGQVENQKAHAAIISEEMAAFTHHITPRQVSQPAYLRRSILPPLSSTLRTEDTREPLWS